MSGTVPLARTGGPPAPVPPLSRLPPACRRSTTRRSSSRPRRHRRRLSRPLACACAGIRRPCTNTGAGVATVGSAGCRCAAPIASRVAPCAGSCVGWASPAEVAAGRDRLVLMRATRWMRHPWCCLYHAEGSGRATCCGPAGRRPAGSSRSRRMHLVGAERHRGRRGLRSTAGQSGVPGRRGRSPARRRDLLHRRARRPAGDLGRRDAGGADRLLGRRRDARTRASPRRPTTS